LRARQQHRIWPAELDLMAQLAGFELETRHADWTGTDFTAESRSHVSIYRIPLTSSLVLQPDFVTCGAGVLDGERPPLDDHGL
jgi:hypothetical protein